MSQSLRLPAYRHHKPSNQAVVTIRGKDYYLGPWNSNESKQKYRRLVAEFLTAGSVEPAAKGNISVGELVECYLEHARSYYRCRQQIDRVERAVLAAADLYGTIDAVDFGPLAIQAVRKVMVDSGKLNRRSVNQRIDCIRLMFRWAVGKELLPASVPDALYMVERLKVGRTPDLREPGDVPPAPGAHIEAAIKHAFGPVAAMIRLQVLTGMRPGEVVDLSQAELNRNGRVEVAKGDILELPGVWVYEPDEWKMGYTGGRRIILVGPQAQSVLEPFLDRPADLPLFSPAEATAERSRKRREERKTPIYESHLRRMQALKPKSPERKPQNVYTTCSYRRAIFYACSKAGVPPFHPHQLRHNATDNLVKQFGWEVARVILGHSSINTTRIYATEDLEKAADAMRKAG